MENGGKFENFPGLDPEREIGGDNLEQLGQELAEKLRADIDHEYGRSFEAPKQFEEEDEKARRAEMSDEESALQAEIDELGENITHTTQQLAVVPLTFDQQVLLERINQLIAERGRSASGRKKTHIDAEIDHTTKQLAALPVTPEQGALLDDILALMDQREKTSVKLRAAYNSRAK